MRLLHEEDEAGSSGAVRAPPQRAGEAYTHRRWAVNKMRAAASRADVRDVQPSGRLGLGAHLGALWGSVAVIVRPCIFRNYPKRKRRVSPRGSGAALDAPPSHSSTAATFTLTCPPRVGSPLRDARAFTETVTRESAPEALRGYVFKV